MRVKFDETQTAMAKKRRSSTREYTDGDATTRRYDAVTHVGRAKNNIPTTGTAWLVAGDGENTKILQYDERALATYAAQNEILKRSEHTEIERF